MAFTKLCARDATFTPDPAPSEVSIDWPRAWLLIVAAVELVPVPVVLLAPVEVLDVLEALEVLAPELEGEELMELVVI